ncbi:MAG TPA: ABC transporter ATP-binding protein [Candidatus Ozemobacteraceae bacterium]
MNSTIPPDAPQAPSPTPAIRVTDLSKRFGRVRAVDGMSFTIPTGSVCGFLGSNGAGKTTTLRLLLGLARPDEGEMELLGRPMPASRTEALERTGTLVEKPSFIEHFTGFENLWWFGSLTAPLTRERVGEALELVGLSDAAHKPFGIYSTGMKQRLGVAGAILHHPSLLLLDEPTNGMDPQGRAQMRDILRDIHTREKTTIFLSSHLLDEVQRLCDYVVIVDHGRTVRQGFVSELLNDGHETWELRLPAEDLSRAIEVLKALPAVLGINPVPRGLEVSLSHGVSHEINQALVGAGIRISALIPREASLEATFLALTDTEPGADKS